MFKSTRKALAAAITGILFTVQTHTGFRLSWSTPETVSTIIGLITLVLVCAFPDMKPA